MRKVCRISKVLHFRDGILPDKVEFELLYFSVEVDCDRFHASINNLMVVPYCYIIFTLAVYKLRDF